MGNITLCLYLVALLRLISSNIAHRLRLQQVSPWVATKAEYPPLKVRWICLFPIGPQEVIVSKQKPDPKVSSSITITDVIDELPLAQEATDLGPLSGLIDMHTNLSPSLVLQPKVLRQKRAITWPIEENKWPCT